MKKKPNFLSKINWHKVGRVVMFALKASSLILARLVYLLGFELVKFVKRLSIFSYNQTLNLRKELIRRKVWPKTKRALHLGAAITWLLSKNLTKQFVKQTKKFVVFVTPYVKKYTKTFVKYSRRFYKQTKVVVTYFLIRIQKTEAYKKVEKTTQKQVIQPLLKTATSRKPYAIALMVILFVTSSLVFLNDQNAIQAATNTWTQTDWSGGQGSSTTNQYDSVSGLATSTSGQLTLPLATDPYRTPITIDNTQVSGSSDHTNFIALISATSTDWKSTGNGGNVAQTDGGDIKFTSSDGTTQLDHEIDTYTATTGHLVAWVKIPTLSYNSDTVIYMYYGNSAGSLDYSNVTSTWSDYAGVWHLDEGDSTATDFYKDSTLNANHGTLVDSDGDTVVGEDKFGGSINFNGDRDYLTVADDDSLSFGDGSTDSPMTISAWIKSDNQQGAMIMGKYDSATTEYEYKTGLTNQWDTRLYDDDDTTANYLREYSGTSVAVITDTWKYVSVTYDGSSDDAGIIQYLDGAVWSTHDSTGGTYTAMENTTAPLTIGIDDIANGSPWPSLNGDMDEVRISTLGRSADWVATEFANQGTPDTFISLGTEEGQYTTTSVSGWGYAAWPYRSAITIDNSEVSGSSNLTNFPVLINSTSTNWKSIANGGYVAQADGGDILFTNGSGTKLDHEIESYTASTGKLVAWVEVDTVDYDDDTTIYMYYGNTEGSLDESNVAGVWPTADYAAVWHLGDGDSTDADFYQDSTANNNDGTLTDSDGDTVASTGKIGGAIDLNGDSDYITIPDDDSLSFGNGVTDSPFSISAWVNMDTVTSFPIIAKTQNNALSAGFAGEWIVRHSSTSLVANVIGGTTNNYIGRSAGDNTANAGTWIKITMVYDGSDTHSGVKIYIDDTQVDTSNSGAGTYVATDNTSQVAFIGRSSASGHRADGEIDNVVMYRSELSSDWIATEYANQNAPETFYTVGSLDSGYTTQLVSAAFDTGEAGSLVSQISWTETLPSNTDVLFQIRTSADGTTWTDFLGPTSASDFYTDKTGGETINSTHSSGGNDRYIQYLAILTTTDGTVTPTLSDVSIQYTANAAPQFNDDYPSASAGGSSASVSTDGASSVTLNYSVRDIDTDSGSVTPGYITPSFEYSLNGGSTWANITSTYLGGSDLDNDTVDESDYTVHSATWDAESQVGTSVYVTNAQVRTTSNDNEGGNNIATSTTANFTLDTTNPALGATPMTVDASVSPAVVGLSCADDTAITMQIGLESDLSDASYVSYSATTTLAGVGTPSDVIYGRCKDAFGNETAIQSVTTPTQPTNMYYQDISNVSESDYSLFISWSTVPAPSAGFASYKLYRSTDGSSYSLYQTIATRTTNYYIDTGLSTGTTYYYKLFVLDDDGNKSAYSAVVSDDPDGTGGTDNTSPTISSVSATSTPMEATVTWTTDELSNSTVYYSATTSDPGTTPGNYALSQGVGSFVTSHSVALANLTPGTQYYYLVRSTDNLNNIGTDSSSGTFTTGAGVSISAVSATPIYNEEATIVWNTDAVADSTVYYSVNSDMSSSSSLNSASTTQAHSLNITGLTGGTTYYYYVESTESGNTTSDKNVVDGITEYYTFTTTSDATAPVITSVNNALIGETGVTIAWTTDEGGTSQVVWGPTSSLGSTTTETSTYTTQHAVTISGLSTQTTYYYKVRAEDRANNASIDDNSAALYTVTTNAPGGGGGGINMFGGDTQAPITSGFDPNTGKYSATITFTTDEPAGAKFSWGPESNSDFEINKSSIYQTSHVFNLTDLLPGKVYFYKLETVDVSGNQAIKKGSFMTVASDSEDAEPVEDPTLDLGDIDTNPEVEPETDPQGETGQSNETDIIELTRSASAGTVREVLESVFDNSNLFNIPSDFLLASASKLANNFDFSVVSNEDLKKIDQEFLFENLRIAAVTGQTATATWRTTVPTKTGILLTDLRTGKTRDLVDPSFLLSHEYTVDKLEPTSSYSLQVVAENEFGEKLGSQSLSFSTFVDRSEPTISDLKTTTSILSGKENKVQAIISWKTNKPATSRVLYEAGVGEGDDFRFSSADNQSYTYEHVVVVSGLQPGQVYRMRAESVDGQGQAVYSKDRTLITPRSKESIVDVIIENFEQTFGFLR